MRSRTVYPLIRRALPAGDPVARLIARVLVLRADLQLEYGAVGTDDGYAGLDDRVSIDYRRLYFFRATSRTIYSGRIALHALAGNETFKQWLAEATQAQRDGWTTNKKAVDRQHGT
jgi:hypothetical protein